jgi:hypothetical protein
MLFNTSKTWEEEIRDDKDGEAPPRRMLNEMTGRHGGIRSVEG